LVGATSPKSKKVTYKRHVILM